MNRLLFYVSVTFLAVGSVFGQPEFDWSSTFGGSENDAGSDIVQTADGAFIVLGNTSSFGQGPQSARLSSVSENGVENWNVLLSTSGSDGASSVIQTLDNGIFMLGYTDSLGSHDIWLVKTNAQGVPLWNRTYGRPSVDIGNEIIKLSDGNYLILGNSYNQSTSSQEIVLIKIDTEGGAIWTRYYSAVGELYGDDVQELPNGNIAVCGKTSNNGMLLMADADGGELWRQTYGGASSDVFRSFEILPNGDFIFVGTTSSIGNGNEDGWIVKTNSTGSLISSIPFGTSNSENFQSIYPCQDGNFIITGDAWHESYSLIKINPDLQILWEKTISTTGRDFLFRAIQNSDQSYCGIGLSNTSGEGLDDIHLVKFTREEYTGSTKYVDPSGEDLLGYGSGEYPFQSIQYAAQHSAGGDTINLGPGEYFENVYFNHDTLTVLGDTISASIVNGGNIESCFSIDSSSVDIFNISFTNGSVHTWPQNGSGIRYYESQGTVNNCVIYGNNSTLEGSSAGGIGVNYSSVNIIECEIYNNSAADIGGGIGYIWSSGTVSGSRIHDNSSSGIDPRGGGGIAIWHSNVNIDHSLIHDNNATRGGGIWIQNISSLNVLNCTITENTASVRSGGISQYDWNNNSVTIENSIVWGNVAPANPDYGIGEPEINYSLIQWPTGVGNINSDPLFSDGYSLSVNSPAIDAGNLDLDGDGDSWVIDADDQDPDGTRMDIGAYYYHQYHTDPVWYVSTEGSDQTGDGSEEFPLATIQFAIDRSQDSDTVLVISGLYDEDINFLGKSIVLGSQLLFTGDTSFISSTIINGSVNIEEAVDSTALFTGFTVQNSAIGITCTGDPELSYLRINGHTSRGIDLSGANVLLSHSQIYNNATGVYSQGSELSMRDMIIFENNALAAGAGITFQNGILNLDSVNISDNHVTNGAGGIWSNTADVLITHSLISGNSGTYGGGIQSGGGGSLTMDDVRIDNNQASEKGGGVYIGSGTIVIRNCIVEENEAPEGGGIYKQSGQSLTLENVDIISNHANSGGGLWTGYDVNLFAANTHFDNNNSTLQGGGISFYSSNLDTLILTECWVQGNTSTYGGGIYITGCSPRLSNVLITDNTAANNGGAIYLQGGGSDPTLNNVTIANNLATNLGGGLFGNGTPIIKNSIIFHNNPLSILEPIATYSDIEEGIVGIGNISIDPQFLDIGNADYHLFPNSPCIDAGDPDDQDPDGTRMDMGAFYFNQSNLTPQISITPDSLGFSVNTADSFEQSQTLTISNTGGAVLEVGINRPLSVTDIDGNIYSTVQIGDQIWMAENLKVTHYQDGTPITHVTDGLAWGALTSEAYCIINDNAAGEVDTYGALYNWYAIADLRNIAPQGWHVPTDDEWKEMELSLGMSQSEADGTMGRGTDEGSKLASNATLWNDGELESNAEFGTSGFAALPGGYRSEGNGQYPILGGQASFWSATERLGNNSYAWIRTLAHDDTDVYRNSFGLTYGFSIRCVKNLPTDLVDNSDQFKDDPRSENLDLQNGAEPHLESLRDNHDSWLTINPDSLTIEPGSSADVILTINAEGLELGNYSDVISIISNDPTNGTIEIPVSMNVIFQDLIPPEVQLNIPDISELVQNGDTLTVTWTASDNVGIDWAKLFFTSNGGASFSLYDSVDADLGELEWIAPDVISNSCNFAIWVSDLAGNVSADTLAGSFAIEDGTVPQIAILTPTQTTSVREHDSLFVLWNASDNIGIDWFELWYSNKPSDPFESLGKISGDDTTFAFGIGAGVSDSARIKMDVMDVAGNLAEAYSGYFSITDNTSPVISYFLIPDTVEWGIGTVMDIGVMASDNVEVIGLDLYYSTDEGATWLPIVEDLYPVQGRPTYSWLIPDAPGECQVQAVVTDAVGLTASAYSDVFSIVIEYPRLIASLPEIKPNGDIYIRFSQLMDSLDISAGAQVIGSVKGSYEIEGELSGYDVTISTPNGFASLDTLTLILTSSAWTNRYGYALDGNSDGVYDGNSIDNDTSYTFVSAAGDFDQNGILDFDDFDDFVIAWHNGITDYELAPHLGEIPHISIQPDSLFNIFDLATFASMWNWAAGISLSAPLTESFSYEEFISEQLGNDLSVVLPRSEFLASQTIVKYDQNLVQIVVADKGLAKVSSSALSFVDVNPDSGFILITSSHLTESNEDQLNLRLIPSTKQRYSIEIAFQGSDVDANVVQKRSLVELLPIPTSFSLSQNYPNPFNASTTIEYGLPKNSDLSISIYDIRGRFVRDIYSGEQQAGYHLTQWNGSNDAGQNVASGLYFIVLHTPEYRMARKALILK